MLSREDDLLVIKDRHSKNLMNIDLGRLFFDKDYKVKQARLLVQTCVDYEDFDSLKKLKAWIEKNVSPEIFPRKSKSVMKMINRVMLKYERWL